MFLQVQITASSWRGTKMPTIVNAMSKENQIDKSLEVLLAENERVKRFGFTKTEFERQKEEMLSQYEKASKGIR